MATVSDITASATEAAEKALSKYDIDSGENHECVAGVLKIFAAHNLLTFRFSDPLQEGAASGDMDRACEIIGALAEHSCSLASIYMLSGLLGPLCISYAGTKEQKAELLPRAARGELQLAFALTEPEAGSDAGSLSTRATRQGDTFILTGEKTYITGASSADVILTVAKTSTENPKAFGIFAVPRDTANLTLEPLKKMAGNAHASCRLEFAGVAVSADQVVGGLPGLENAWSTLRLTGELERLIVSAIACGLARAATRRASTFIRERHQFGQALTNFQGVQHMVVEMNTLTTGMQLFLDHALRAHARGSGATQAISMAKYFCSEQLQRVVEMAVRVMGGRAYFDFEPVSRIYREAPFCLFAGGTVEIQKMLIARTLAL